MKRTAVVILLVMFSWNYLQSAEIKDDFFCLNLHSINKKSLISELKLKKTPYKSYNSETLTKHSNDFYNNIVETKYFSGCDIEINKIINVKYDFSNIGYIGNSVILQLKKEYYKVFVSLLDNKFGKHQTEFKKVLTNDTNQYKYEKWSTVDSKNNKYLIIISFVCGTYDRPQVCEDRFNAAFLLIKD